jgi:hypothetical protein
LKHERIHVGELLPPTDNYPRPIRDEDAARVTLRLTNFERIALTAGAVCVALALVAAGVALLAMAL